MNIKFISDNKFKSNSISLNIPLDIDEKICDLNLISEMIKLGCEKYDSLKKLYTKLQEMYGTYFNCYVNKCGEVAILTIYIEFIKDKYIYENKSLWRDVIDFLYECFYNVLQKNGVFNEELLEIEKQNHGKLIRSLVDSKGYYAYVRCEQMATETEPYFHYVLGDEKRLDSINGMNLYKYFDKEIRQMPYYFLVTGEFDEEDISRIICQKFSDGINKRFSTENNKFCLTEFCEKYERFDVSQTKLVINYKTPVNIFNGDYYAFFIFNKILGGGYSILYREIRQKRNLVYYINSYYEKFKGMLSIECGIEDENLDLAKELIFNEIENMGNGRITLEDIENVKENSKRILYSLEDRIVSIHSFVNPLLIFDKNYNIQEFIKEIDKVNLERIVAVSNEIYKTAVFSVRPNIGKGTY